VIFSSRNAIEHHNGANDVPGATRVEKVPIGELEEDNRAPNYAQLTDDREVTIC
jgi:hypothetical protein